MTKFVEINISNFDSSKASFRSEILEAHRDGLALRVQQVSLAESGSRLSLAAAHRISEEGVWPTDAVPQLGSLFAAAARGDRPAWVHLDVDRSAAPLRRMHWESHPALADQVVVRYQVADGLPRPGSLPHPQRVILAVSERELEGISVSLGLANPPFSLCSLRRLRETLVGSAGNTSPRDAVVILAVHASLEYGELVVDEQWGAASGRLALGPFLASLRDAQGDFPQIVALLLLEHRSNVRAHVGPLGGQPLVLAHEAVAAGIPMVVVAHGVRRGSSPTLSDLANHLRQQIQTQLAEEREGTTAQRVHAAFSQGLASTSLDGAASPPPTRGQERPVIVTRFRSGQLWASREPSDDNAAAQQFWNASRRTVVVGPQRLGGQSGSPNETYPWQPTWLRAPLDILSSILRIPMYPEDMQGGYSVGSYIQAMLQDRRRVEATYYLCWIRQIYTHLRDCNLTRNGARNSADQQYEDFLNASLAAAGSDDIDEKIFACFRLLLSPAEAEADQGRIASFLGVDAHLLQSLGPDALVQRIADRLERRLKDLINLYCPLHRDANQHIVPSSLRADTARQLLERTAAWPLAQLRADLYVTVDPLPFLEYALTLQGERGESVPLEGATCDVSYTVFPWYLQASAFYKSRAAADSPTPNGVHRVVYLCGAVSDPPVLLLSEEEVVERLIGARLAWSHLLTELGECLGRDACTLFLGFSPDDSMFRQILRTLFLERQSSSGPRLVVAPRPDGGFYSYPEQGAAFLARQLRRNIWHTAHREALAETTPTTTLTAAPPPAGGAGDPESGIRLIYREPELFVRTLLESRSTSQQG